MTTTDYVINGLFVLLVVRQARERRLDVRSLVVPIVLVAFVAHMYLRSIPTMGGDPVLIGSLASRVVHCVDFDSANGGNDRPRGGVGMERQLRRRGGCG